MPKGTFQIKYEKLVMDNLDLKERVKELETKNKRLQNDHNCAASLCDSMDEFGEPMKDTQWTNLGERIYEIVVEQVQQVKKLEAALNAIWPFIEEDFPKGTGENHGTCATDKYVEAARLLEQALKPGT